MLIGEKETERRGEGCRQFSAKLGPRFKNHLDRSKGAFIARRGRIEEKDHSKVRILPKEADS
jgi:hypothetical protein